MDDEHPYETDDDKARYDSWAMLTYAPSRDGRVWELMRKSDEETERAILRTRAGALKALAMERRRRQEAEHLLRELQRAVTEMSVAASR